MKIIPAIFFLCFITTDLYSQCYGLVWQDEFDGTAINTSNWTHEVNALGGYNNELQWYTARPENSYVSNGNLVIRAVKETYTSEGQTREYTSARMISQHKADWKYGMFEIRAKLPKGQGIWPAIWMMPTSSVYGGWPASGEIDIMEQLGHQPGISYGTIHYGTSPQDHQHQGSSYALPSGDFSDDYHIFAVRWKEDSISWYIDGHRFYSRSKQDIGAYHWPFDQEFYFILNVAVGGDWPGSPDGTTVFPQTMSIDYIRVYQDIADVNTVIEGKTTVFENEVAGYSVPQTDNGNYEWLLPAGATIVEGEGSNNIKVRWGASAGSVILNYSASCGNKQLQLPVQVLKDRCGIVYDDFEEVRTSDYIYVTGTLTPGQPNPLPDAVNPSPAAGKYVRNATQQYDILCGRPLTTGDPADFLNGSKKFYMDVYSASPGTLVQFQLEDNSRTATEPYPAGRHSQYAATTTKTNEWERLEFNYTFRPDGNMPHEDVDSYIIMFAPDTYTGNTFYIDNLHAAGTGVCGPVTGTSRAIAESNYHVFPNPSGQTVFITYKGTAAGETALSVTDMLGKVLLNEYFPAGSDRCELSLEGLTKGLYLLRISNGGKLETVKIFKN